MRDWVAVSLCIGLAFFIYRRVLGAYFSPDDFILLERARGLAPVPATIWRALSGTAYWWVAARVFGGNPLPYHVVMLTLHAANVALLFVLIRRMGGSVAVATLASGAFATSRLFFSAIYPASSVGELLALCLSLGALLVIERPQSARRQIYAVGLFGAGLLCKESVALLPLAWMIGSRRHGSARARLRIAAPLLGTAALLACALFVMKGSLGSLGGYVYAWTFGWHALTNLARYTAAGLEFSRVVPDPDAPGMVGIGSIGLLGVVALSWRAWRTTRIPALGVAGWLLGLVPVLPLQHVRYLHYTYAPGAFLAASAAALLLWPVEAMCSRQASVAGSGRARGGARHFAPGIIAAVLLSAHAVQAERSIAARHSWRLQAMDLPYDSILRKMVFSQRVIEGLRPAVGTDSARIAWVFPSGTERVVSVRSGRGVGAEAVSGPRHNFLMAVLDSGRAIRAMLPQVRDVRFVGSWSPELSGYLIVTNRIDGWMTIHGEGSKAHASLVEAWWRSGLRAQAINYLESVLSQEPDDELERLLGTMKRAAERLDTSRRVER